MEPMVAVPEVTIKTEPGIDLDEVLTTECDPIDFDATDGKRSKNHENICPNAYYDMMERGSMNYPEELSFYEDSNGLNLKTIWKKLKALEEENRKMQISHHLMIKEIMKENQSLMRTQYFVLKEIIKLRDEGWDRSDKQKRKVSVGLNGKRTNEDDLLKETKFAKMVFQQSDSPVPMTIEPLLPSLVNHDENEEDNNDDDMNTDVSDVQIKHFMDDFIDEKSDIDEGLYKLPCQTATEFEELEDRVKSDSQYETFLTKIFDETEERDLRTYLSKNLTTLLTDDASFSFSWHGQQGNVPLKNYKIVRLLKECAMKKYDIPSEKLFIDTTKKCFENRKDRVRKDRYRKANRLKRDWDEAIRVNSTLGESQLPPLVRMVNEYITSSPGPSNTPQKPSISCPNVIPPTLTPISAQFRMKAEAEGHHTPTTIYSAAVKNNPTAALEQMTARVPSPKYPNLTNKKSMFTILPALAPLKAQIRIKSEPLDDVAQHTPTTIYSNFSSPSLIPTIALQQMTSRVPSPKYPSLVARNSQYSYLDSVQIPTTVNYSSSSTDSSPATEANYEPQTGIYSSILNTFNPT